MEELKKYKGKQGLYIITPKNKELLKDICDKLGYEHTSNISYIGKGEIGKTTDLYKRARQEMGYTNFEGATYVRKMGLYLGFDVKDKKNKVLQTKTREFILENFNIECVVLEGDVQSIETQYIKELQPCLNDKKKK